MSIKSPARSGIGFGQIQMARSDLDVEQMMVDMKLPSLPIWLATHQALRHTPRIARVRDALAEGLAPNLS
ncbi:MAG: hypothetical protein RQ750_15385 [Roseovarius sp.]|nr:hypothetical protein [Roseovarius sp.]